MKAIIAGGGIAGHAAALALRRRGLGVTVLEARAEEDADGGLFLSLSSNGLRALSDLGLDCREGGINTVPTDRMTFHRSDGTRIAEAPMGSPQGPPPLTVRRADLARFLEAAARDAGAEVRHGARLVDYRETAGGVEVALHDGETLDGDLLIGADGIHSRVRTIMLGGAFSASYTGLVNFGGIVPASGLPPTPNAMRMIWGRKAFFGYTVQPDGEAWWFANLGMPENGAWSLSNTEMHRQRLLDQFAGDLSDLSRLIGRTGTLRAYPIHDLPSIPSWHKGRALLIGDAAHAMSPSAGQGASLALEDAVYLGVCLDDCDEPETAFRCFEAGRRPRAEQIVREGRRRGEYKAPQNGVQRWLRDLIVPLMLRIFASPRALSWIYDYRVPRQIDRGTSPGNLHGRRAGDPAAWHESADGPRTDMASSRSTVSQGRKGSGADDTSPRLDQCG